MKYISLFWKTCKVEGFRKAILRSIAQLMGLKIIGFNEKEKKENKLLDKYKIPKECIQQPIFLHSSVKRAMFYEPDKTQILINTCFAQILISYVKTMNALGMGVYQERRKILELALNVSDNEKYFEHLAYAIINQWEWEGPSEKLLLRCERLLPKIKKKEIKITEIYLIYISSLLEMNKDEKARVELSEYVRVYSKKNIHLYYPVAKLALVIGIENEKIKKAAYIYDVILQNKNVLSQYLQGKNVAVVGSGPSEVGKSKGKEIDAHDVVIRFNDYKINGYEQDYGSKTTVWVRNIDTEYGGCKPRYDEIRKYDVIVLEADIWRFQIPEMFLDTFYQYALYAGDKFCMLQYRDQMIREMGSFPTSGGLMLYNLSKIRSNNIEVYGFDFLKSEDNNKKKMVHYSKEDNAYYRESRLHHNIVKEKQFLRKYGRQNNEGA